LQNRWVQAAFATVLLLGGLWIVGELIPERPAWEVSVMEWMADQRSSFFDDVNGTVTAFGSPAFTFIALGVAAAWALVWKRSPLWFAFLLLCMLAPAVYDRMLKQLIERPRPNFSRALDVSGYGFPSGHATSAVTVAGALFVLFLYIGPKKARPIVLMVAVAFLIAVAASRVYLGVHWPTDVLGGFFLGAGWVAICAFTLSIPQPSAQQPPPP
jgi:membrane-associated phospholipid phosphatase